MPNTRAIILFTQKVRLSRGNPNEPFTAIAWEDIDLLFSAMLTDLVEQITKIQSVDIFVSVNSTDLQDDFLIPFQRKVNILENSSLTLPQRISSTMNNVFENGYHRLILFMQHYPLIGAEFFNSVFNQLNFEEECVVLGTSKSERVSLFGVKSNYSDWFDSGRNASPVKTDSSYIETDYILKKACTNDIMIFNTQNIPSVDNGYDLERLKRNIEHSMTTIGFFAKHTYEMFKFIENKYFSKKRKDEDWDTRRYI
jgi:hypothetical protein